MALPLPIPATMWAWHRPSRGPVTTHLHLATTYTTPEPPHPDSGDVLVRVSHVALEYGIAIIMPIFPSIPFRPPLVPEVAFSGTVVASGSKALSEVREVGTRVMGFQTLPRILFHSQGVLAEYVKVPGEQLIKLPDVMMGEAAMAQAAGLNASGSTARKMIRTAVVKAGDRVLVNGAGGSVGLVVVQLLKERGASVVGVASGRNAEMVRGNGADEVSLDNVLVVLLLNTRQFVDYTAHASLPTFLASTYGSAPFDHIFDCVGSQELYVKSPAYLKEHGDLINIGAMITGIGEGLWNWFQNTWRPVWLGGTPRKYVMFSTPLDRNEGVLLLRMVEEGKLRVPIDSIWEMEEALKGYERLTSKRARGKVIIKVERA